MLVVVVVVVVVVIIFLVLFCVGFVLRLFFVGNLGID